MSTQNRKVECNHVYENNYKYGLSRSNPIVTPTFTWTLATSQHACLKNKVRVFCLLSLPRMGVDQSTPSQLQSGLCRGNHIYYIDPWNNWTKQTSASCISIVSVNEISERFPIGFPSYASLLFTLKKIMLFVGGQRLWEMQDGTHNVTSSSSK